MSNGATRDAEAAEERDRHLAHLEQHAETWREERDEILEFVRHPTRRRRLERWSGILRDVGDVGDGLLEFSSGLLAIVDEIGARQSTDRLEAAGRHSDTIASACGVEPTLRAKARVRSASLDSSTLAGSVRLEPDSLVEFHGDTATVSRKYLSSLEEDCQDLDAILRHLRAEKNAECLQEWDHHRAGDRWAQKFAAGLLDLLGPINARDRSLGLIVGDGKGTALPPFESRRSREDQCSTEEGSGTPPYAKTSPPRPWLDGPSDWKKVELDPKLLRRETVDPDLSEAYRRVGRLTQRSVVEEFERERKRSQTVQVSGAATFASDGWTRREIDKAAKRLSNTSSVSVDEIRTAIYQYALVYRVGWCAAADAMPDVIDYAAKASISLIQAIDWRVGSDESESTPKPFRLVQTPAIQEVGKRIQDLESRIDLDETLLESAPAKKATVGVVLDNRRRIVDLEARPDPTEISGRLENWRRIDTEFVDKALEQIETFFDDGLGAAGEKWAAHHQRLRALEGFAPDGSILEAPHVQDCREINLRLQDVERWKTGAIDDIIANAAFDERIRPIEVALETGFVELRFIDLERSMTETRRRFVAFVATHSDTRSRLDKIEKSIGRYSVSRILGEIDDHIGSEDHLHNEALHDRIAKLEEKKEVGILTRLEPLATSIAQLQDLVWRLARWIQTDSRKLTGAPVAIAERLEGREAALAGPSLLEILEARRADDEETSADDDALDDDPRVIGGRIARDLRHESRRDK